MPKRGVNSPNDFSGKPSNDKMSFYIPKNRKVHKQFDPKNEQAFLYRRLPHDSDTNSDYYQMFDSQTYQDGQIVRRPLTSERDPGADLATRAAPNNYVSQPYPEDPIGGGSRYEFYADKDFNQEHPDPSRAGFNSFLSRWEGRTHVWDPINESEYNSQWKRYQKALAMRPDSYELRQSTFRFLSANSPIGYWEVTFQQVTDYAIETDGGVILNVCDQFVPLSARSAPPGGTIRWTQLSGNPGVFVPGDIGPDVLFFRANTVGPYLVKAEIIETPGAEVEILILTIPLSGFLGYGTRDQTEELNKFNPNTFSVSTLFPPSLLQNYTLNRPSSFTFDPPVQNQTSIVAYSLTQNNAGTYVQIATSPPFPRVFQLPPGPRLKVVTFFNTYGRLYQSESLPFALTGENISLVAHDEDPWGYGNRDESAFTRFPLTAIALSNPDYFIGYGNRDESIFTRLPLTAIALTGNLDHFTGYGNRDSSSFERNDLAGTIIG
jgi:hypothetical protein